MQPFLQMGRRETVVFSEDSVQVALPSDAPPPPPGQQWQWCKVIPILTSDRIIFFDEAPPLQPPAFALKGCPPQTIPVMALRMIVRLEDITALQLSPGADDALVVSVRPATTVTYASVMEPDDAGNNCRGCGVEFSFFGKHRHHCRWRLLPLVFWVVCSLCLCLCLCVSVCLYLNSSHSRGCGQLFCHECSPELTRRFPTNRVHQVVVTCRCCDVD
jgi:hypothetical protein